MRESIIERVDILYIVVASVIFITAVVVATIRFFGSVIKAKGKALWTKLADWFETILEWLP